MINEILGKALIVVKMDASQAKAEAQSLKGVEKAAAEERIKAQDAVNASWDRSLKQHALMVAGVSAGIAIAIASVKKYQEHLKEIGNTGGEEFARIQRASEAATKAQESLQIALGRIVVAALPVVEAFAQMAQELGNIAGGISRIVQMAGQLGGGYVGKGLSFLQKTNPVNWSRYGLSWGADQINKYFPEQSMADTSVNTDAEYAANAPDFNERQGAEYGDGGMETIHPRVAKALGWVYVTSPEGGFWRPPTDAEKAKRKKAGLAGAKQRGIYDAAWLKLADQIGGTSGDALGNGNLSDLSSRTDLTDAELLGLSAGDATGGDFSQFGDYEPTTLKSLDASMAAAKQITARFEQRESMLEKIFGPVEEFDLYQTAWQGLESVVTAGLDAWITGSKSVGEAMKEALHGFAKQLAGEALLQALRHGAYALGSLAFGDVPAAGKHGLAALKWAGVAAIAAGVGKITAPSAGGYSAAGIGGGARGSAGGGTNLTIVQGDGFSDSSPRYVARRTRRAIDLASRYAPYDGGQSG